MTTTTEWAHARETRIHAIEQTRQAARAYRNAADGGSGDAEHTAANDIAEAALALVDVLDHGL